MKCDVELSLTQDEHLCKQWNALAEAIVKTVKQEENEK